MSRSSPNLVHPSSSACQQYPPAAQATTYSLPPVLLAMVLQNGYVTGSMFGPEWKHVQEWPQAGPSRLHGESGEAESVQDAVDEDEYEEEEEEVR